ncbi:MAG: hypothetical protein CMN77_19655 [Spirochaetaceae bacterium]|nr:hypothetical protein [Spirochaetaceae bacterium]|tara:strand:+ start:32660 stop:34477 length:1818 start_codon:yes stop_codon:yes gene_type:complete
MMAKFCKTVLLLLTLTFVLPGNLQAVPGDFGPADFSRVLTYAQLNYLDRRSIDQERGYVDAARTAIGSMPAPLELLPASYLDRRKEFSPFGIVMPGQVLKLPWTDKYVLFQIDASKLEEVKNKRDAIQKKKWEGLSEDQRQKEARQLKEKQQLQRKVLDEMWDATGFDGQDFTKVMSWIQDNRLRFGTSPTASNTEDEDSEEEKPSGPPTMNYYYFQAARGFLKSFDPHADLLDSKVWEKIRKESEDATFEGIGAILRGGDEEDVIVETPFPGSPALRSGLKAGDIIRKVDGKSISNLSLREVVKRIRGPRGTVVSLEVDRPTDLTTREIKIERDVIERKAVDSTYLKDHNIGIIHIRSFLFHETPITEMVREAYEDIKKAAGGDPAGLIIDLRNNPGGDLGEAVRVTGLFMEEERIVTSLKSNRNSRELESDGYPIVPDKLPIMVLVDAGSASASEIMASALQDYQRALIVGDRTFGKATVQQIQPLETNSSRYLVKLTIARYYAPNGYTVQVHGVQPDIRISDQKDGEFPLRFREEDMWHHLPELAQKDPNPQREKWVESLKKKVNPKQAEKYLKEHENDAVRPDYMLQRALPYLKAMIQEKD